MQCEYMCSNMSSDRNTKKKRKKKERSWRKIDAGSASNSEKILSLTLPRYKVKQLSLAQHLRLWNFWCSFPEKRGQMFAIFLNPHRNNSFTNIFTIICANLQICIWEQTSRTHCVSSVSFFAPWLITRRRFPGAKRMGVNLLSQSESTLGHITLSAEANPRPSASDQWLWHPPFWHSELPRGSLFWSEYRAETSY